MYLPPRLLHELCLLFPDRQKPPDSVKDGRTDVRVGQGTETRALAEAEGLGVPPPQTKRAGAKLPVLKLHRKAGQASLRGLVAPRSRAGMEVSVLCICCPPSEVGEGPTARACRRQEDGSAVSGAGRASLCLTGV